MPNSKKEKHFKRDYRAEQYWLCPQKTPQKTPPLLCPQKTPPQKTPPRELAKLFADSTAGLVYVTAFPSRAIMSRYLAEIAWETEVWVVLQSNINPADSGNAPFVAASASRPNVKLRAHNFPTLNLPLPNV